MIYENDIPTCEQAYQTYRDSIFRENQKSADITRWKPNGITNNIGEWEKKAGLENESPIRRIWKHALSKAVYNYCKKQRYSAN